MFVIWKIIFFLSCNVKCFLFFLFYFVYKENKEPLPKTYVLNNSFEYFKPRIQVEMENKEKPETITEIYIRGKKLKW